MPVLYSFETTSTPKTIIASWPRLIPAKLMKVGSKVSRSCGVRSSNSFFDSGADQHAEPDRDDHGETSVHTVDAHRPDLGPLGLQDLGRRPSLSPFFRCCCQLVAPARGRLRAPRPVRRRGPVRSACAWYSTDSAVSCMNASSREACWGLSSCSTSWCWAASSPSCSAVAAVDLQRAVAGLDGGDARPACSTSSSRSRCGERMPDVRPRVLPDEVGHRGVGEQPALPDDDQVVGGQRHLAHQVARRRRPYGPGRQGTSSGCGSSGCPRGRGR